MLTIKHVHDGREMLLEAEYFVMERRDDGNMQFIAFDETIEDYKETWCGAVNCAPTDQVIYVMNRHGKTVSQYWFKAPTFS